MKEELIKYVEQLEIERQENAEIYSEETLNRLDNLIKDLTFLFNKKRKEDSEKSGKKPAAKAKPSVSAGKGLDRAEKMGAFEDFGVKEDFDGEDDYYEDDFI